MTENFLSKGLQLYDSSFLVKTSSYLILNN